MSAANTLGDVARSTDPEVHLRTSRFVGLLAARPMVSLTIYVLVGIALIAGQMYRVISDVSYKTALEAAIS